MSHFRSFFKNKKITVMGLGLLGRGVGDAIFLAESGAELTITDLKTKAELRSSLQKLRKFTHSTALRAGNIKYVLGKHRLEDFRNADLILKAAGVPLDSPYIKEAKKHNHAKGRAGIPIEMSATLFAKLSGVPMVGVTGTRGKSTVTHLIAHILQSAGKGVILGGNIRGVSNLQLLKKKADLAVFELDSWQLQGFGDNKISPHIAVFTTLFPDHMKYYGSATLTTGETMKKYFADKANIFKFQKKGDILIAGEQALPFIKKWQGKNKEKIKSKIIVPKTELPKGWNLGIKGEHNIYDAVLAIAVARKLKIKDEIIKKALKSFKGVPGRLEFVREVNGIKYYNDTTATTPEAAIAALRALGEDNNIVLIAGGSDKDLTMDSFVREIPRYCKGVVLLSGTGTDLVKNQISNSVETDSLKKAVALARGLAQKGDIILLSPGFASFGMFNNEFDRGDQFVKIIKGLK